MFWNFDFDSRIICCLLVDFRFNHIVIRQSKHVGKLIKLKRWIDSQTNQFLADSNHINVADRKRHSRLKELNDVNGCEKILLPHMLEATSLTSLSVCFRLLFSERLLLKLYVYQIWMVIAFKHDKCCAGAVVYIIIYTYPQHIFKKLNTTDSTNWVTLYILI